jgi:hypothetical protein
MATRKARRVINSLKTTLDGNFYQSKIKDIDQELVISFNLNSDGAPLTKHKSFSMWPVIGTINELNQSSRERFENIIIFGIWISKTKPVYNEFFTSVFSKLNTIINNIIVINGNIFIQV